MAKRLREVRKDLRHDWLPLVESSGLLVSEPVLASAFPEGPPALDGWLLRRFRTEFERYILAREGKDDTDGGRWTTFILEDLLGLERGHWKKSHELPPSCIATLTNYMQELRPSRVLMGEDGKPALLCTILSPGQPLEQPETETGRWHASPVTKFERLLRSSGMPLGLLTNGDEWRLVYAEKNLSTAYMNWSAQTWSEERATLAAFKMLLGLLRFFGPDPETRLLTLAHLSQERQVEVADQLGIQVRSALRLFVRALDEANKKSGGALLAGKSDTEIYEMSVLVMMRLVFLLFAEENDLLPHAEMLYARGYCLSHLAYELEAEYRRGTSGFDLRCDGWERVLAVSRLVHGGCAHLDLNLRPYGGQLFDPARYPILEDPRFSLSNLVLSAILRNLTYARAKLGREWVSQRVSYRTLDVEQIGYLYEGLLDHRVKRAGESPLLLIRGKREKKRPLEMEISLGELETLDLDARVEKLAELTGKSPEAVRYILVGDESESEAEEEEAGAIEEDLDARVKPYEPFLRDEKVIPPGGLYVTLGTSRRALGAHYTPRSLTLPIVTTALLPHVFRTVKVVAAPDGTAEFVGEDPVAAQEILALKVCDMAMGSGAFLVMADRYLAAQLVDAWDRARLDEPTVPLVAPYGEKSMGLPGEDLIPGDHDQKLVLASRLVSDRCLYGVDVNPLAVEMAKLSLWLTTLSKDRPFTFLDHALKCGDSLVGVNLDQLRTWSLDGKGKRREIQEAVMQKAISEALEARRELESFTVRIPGDLDRKEALLEKSEAALDAVRIAGNLLIAPSFVEGSKKDRQHLRQELGAKFTAYDWDLEALREEANRLLDDQRTFHWAFEFPEVFLDGKRKGFDSFVGNPPFMGGQKITGSYGTAYRDYLVATLAEGRKGSADLVSYFFLRAEEGLKPGGTLGLIATNTIAQGDTREVGLDALLVKGDNLYQAMKSMKWPGEASLEVSVVHLAKGERPAQPILDARPAPRISAYLDDSEAEGKPYRLKANEGIAFQGSIVLGMGFVLSEDEAQAMLNRDPRNKDVLYPYLNGEDLNSHPHQKPSRWVINFWDWPEERAATYEEPFERVRKLVKPERDLNNRKARRERWWQFAETASGLYHAIGRGHLFEKHPEGWQSEQEPFHKVLVISRVSKHLAFAFAENSYILNERLTVFAIEDYSLFAQLQSSLHESWMLKYGSTLETRPMYTPSDCFENYPLLGTSALLGKLGIEYYNLRESIMIESGLGFTALYNEFHSPSSRIKNIHSLREAHCAIDCELLRLYLWNDLSADHEFRETRFGLRFCLSTELREEFLHRILALNHQRHEEEVEARALEEPAPIAARPKTRRLKVVPPMETIGEIPAMPTETPSKVSRRASPQWVQAALLTWLCVEIRRRNQRATRFRLEKLLYLLCAREDVLRARELASGTLPPSRQETMAEDLGLRFLEKAAGPYDPDLRYRGGEPLARKKGFLVSCDGDTAFLPGTNAGIALRYAPRYTERFHQGWDSFLDTVVPLEDEVLERGATVHGACVGLARQGKPWTPQAVQAYLNSVPDWRAKLDKSHFSSDLITRSIQGLQGLGLLLREAYIPSRLVAEPPGGLFAQGDSEQASVAPKISIAVTSVPNGSAANSALGANDHLVLDYLRTHPGWHPRADILAATGLSPDQWTNTQILLVIGGLIQKTGEKRGTKYRIMGPSP